MNVLDIFSGIGGFSLGLERAGMRTVAFCEIDPFCQRVLRKHWPNVPIYDDVRTLTAERLRADRITVDLIAGGFPCQDISCAGKGAGIEGERSGLWSEYARIIGDVRPSYVIVENVSALLSRGLDRVLGDLASIGFDAEWHCIPASAVGAPHRRDRIWIVAYPNSGELRQQSECELGSGGSSKPLPNGSTPALADAACERRIAWWTESKGQPRQLRSLWSGVPYAANNAADSSGIRWGDTAGQWRIEPDVGRVAHGVPARVDRLRSLGNAVVPQIPEIIGRAILASERQVAA